MKNFIDYSYKLAVLGLLAFIAFKEHVQTTNKSSYSQSVWIEGGEIKALITNDEKSKIPTTTELGGIALKDNQTLPVTLVNPVVPAEEVLQK